MEEKTSVKDIVGAYVFGGREVLHDSDLLVDDLGLDSLDQVEIAIEVEEEYEVEADDELCGQWGTVGDIVAYSRRDTK